MVFHNKDMPVPTQDECLQTFAGIISACIVQQPGQNDDGSVNLNMEDPSKVSEDPNRIVYQIGAAGYLGKRKDLNTEWLLGSTNWVGGAANYG